MESKTQAKILQYLKQKKVYAFKPIVSNRRGIPDVIACLNGKFIGFEIKDGRNKLSALQEYNIEQIKSSGGTAFAVWTYEEAKVIIDDMVTSYENYLNTIV